jgi:hypothetical protein
LRENTSVFYIARRVRFSKGHQNLFRRCRRRGRRVL